IATSPSARTRAVFAHTVTGLCSAIGWIHEAMPMTGTSAALTNTMGKMPVNIAAWAPSTCLIASATTAEIHEKTNPTESTSAIIPIAPTTPFWNLNPTRYATTITRSSRIRFLATSEVVRPTRTAERAIGSERNRSTRPFFMSSARPIAVVVEPKIAFCTKMPGIRNLFLLGGVAGERQEHVVEGRAMQGDVGDRDAAVVEPAHAVEQCRGTRAPHGDPDPAGLVVERRLAGADPGEDLDDRREVCPILDVELQNFAADLVLELVRRALRDHRAQVDHGDPVGEVVGLLEVLRREQDRLAFVDQLTDHRPEVHPAPWVEPGGRLVEEQHVGAGDEAGRHVEPTPHPA